MLNNNIPPERLDEKGNYILTEEEQKRIVDIWNSGVIALKPLAQEVFKEPIDGKSKQAIAMKKFLAKRNLKPVPSQDYTKKTDTEELPDEDKEFIRNHAVEFKPHQIAKLRWGEDIAVGDLRYRLCFKYYESLPPETWNPKYAVERKDYTPPKTDYQVVARLRDYKICSWNLDKLNTREKEYIKKIIKYTHTYRFIAEMSIITKVEERKTCEAQFLKWVYDKEDLSEEDLDLYINLCLSMLDTRRMREELNALIIIRDEQLEESRNSESGRATVNQPLVESINDLRKEISAKEAKQENTIKKLTGDREQRLKDRGTANVSLSTLVELWKENDKRSKVIALAEARQNKLQQELSELQSMDALKFELWGANPSELLR